MDTTNKQFGHSVLDIDPGRNFYTLTASLEFDIDPMDTTNKQFGLLKWNIDLGCKMYMLTASPGSGIDRFRTTSIYAPDACFWYVSIHIDQWDNSRTDSNHLYISKLVPWSILFCFVVVFGDVVFGDAVFGDAIFFCFLHEYLLLPPRMQQENVLAAPPGEAFLTKCLPSCPLASPRNRFELCSPRWYGVAVRCAASSRL
jgi:hypothetical protein